MSKYKFTLLPPFLPLTIHLKNNPQNSRYIIMGEKQRAGSKLTQHTQEVEKSQDKTLGSKNCQISYLASVPGLF